jgi:hypothetical protein
MHQGVKPGLNEMMIGGKSIRDIVIFHHNERYAVGQRPLFIEPLRIEGNALSKQFGGCRDNGYPRIGPKLIDEPSDYPSLRGTRKSIRQLKEHEFRREHRTPKGIA